MLRSLWQNRNPISSPISRRRTCGRRAPFASIRAYRTTSALHPSIQAMSPTRQRSAWPRESQIRRLWKRLPARQLHRASTLTGARSAIAPTTPGPTPTARLVARCARASRLIGNRPTGTKRLSRQRAPAQPNTLHRLGAPRAISPTARRTTATSLSTAPVGSVKDHRPKASLPHRTDLSKEHLGFCGFSGKLAAVLRLGETLAAHSLRQPVDIINPKTWRIMPKAGRQAQSTS